MDVENNSDKLSYATEAIEKWSKKWLFLFFILTPYFYMSYKIISTLVNFKPPSDPDEIQCGTGLFAAIFAHFVLAGVTALIITIYFIFRPDYEFWIKLLIMFLVLAPPVVSYFAF